MSLKNAVGGVALIAGTAIGAAVLALPVATAHLGFVQTVLIYGICWLFMTMGALYLLEANLFVGYGTNLITMAEKTLGTWGKYLTWSVYLILLYALTAAYLTGAGEWINQALHLIQLDLNPLSCAFIATLLTMIVILLGTRVTDWVNRFLMLGLIGAFLTLIIMANEHVTLEFLQTKQWITDLRPIPLIITGFGFAIVVPTLTDYLHGKPLQLYAVVLIGSLIPLLVYVIWELAILGIIPFSGNPGLLQIQQHGHPITDIPQALQALLQNAWITKATSYFSIFALITSLLGVCLSLFDFLADGLHLRKNLRSKGLLALITFLPPLLFIFCYPRGFTFALSFAGIFVALLLGILPAIMVWQGRYILKLKRSLPNIGGKVMVMLTLLFFILVICIECYNQYEIFLKK